MFRPSVRVPVSLPSEVAREGSVNRSSLRTLRSVWGGRKKCYIARRRPRGANLHSFLGVGFPELSLSDLLQRRVEHIDDVTIPTAYQGVSLVSGAFDTLSAVSPKYAQKIRLLRQIASTGADYTFLDLGSGTGFNVLDFFLIADLGVVSVIPADFGRECLSVCEGTLLQMPEAFRKLVGT